MELTKEIKYAVNDRIALAATKCDKVLLKCTRTYFSLLFGGIKSNGRQTVGEFAETVRTTRDGADI